MGVYWSMKELEAEEKRLLDEINDLETQMDDLLNGFEHVGGIWYGSFERLISLIFDIETELAYRSKTNWFKRLFNPPSKFCFAPTRSLQGELNIARFVRDEYSSLERERELLSIEYREIKKKLDERRQFALQWGTY